VSAVAGLALPAPQEIVAQALPVQGGSPGNAEAAKQFEGMLMDYLFQQMRQTVQPSGLFGDTGTAQSTYEYLLDQATTKKAMDAGKGWGLSQRLAAAWDSKYEKTPKS
jgi:Rod binding domain-containing protein